MGMNGQSVQLVAYFGDQRSDDHNDSLFVFKYKMFQENTKIHFKEMNNKNTPRLVPTRDKDMYPRKSMYLLS